MCKQRDYSSALAAIRLITMLPAMTIPTMKINTHIRQRSYKVGHHLDRRKQYTVVRGEYLPPLFSAHANPNGISVKGV